MTSVTLGQVRFIGCSVIGMFMFRIGYVFWNVAGAMKERHKRHKAYVIKLIRLDLQQRGNGKERTGYYTISYVVENLCVVQFR